MDYKHNKLSGDKSTEISQITNCVDTVAASVSSTSSSYSVITLKDSPVEVVADGNISSYLPESVTVSAAQALDSLEQHQRPRCAECLASSTLPPAADDGDDGDTMLSHQCYTKPVRNKDVVVFVDRLERTMKLRNNAKLLQIVEPTSSMYCYSPSFSCLPVLAESDDTQLSEMSIASGDGYIADGGHQSRLSNTSSPSGSLYNAATSAQYSDIELVTDQQPSTRVRDAVHSRESCTSTFSEQSQHLEGSSFTIVKEESLVISVVIRNR